MLTVASYNMYFHLQENWENISDKYYEKKYIDKYFVKNMSIVNIMKGNISMINIMKGNISMINIRKGNLYVW